MFEFIQKIIIGLLTSLVNASNHTKCVFVTDQKYTLQPTSINVHPNEYTKGLRYYPFEVNLGRVSEVNTFTDLSIKVLCFKQNRRFKSKYAQHDCGNELITNFNKTYIMRMCM